MKSGRIGTGTRHSKGQVLVEIVLVLPVFAFFMFLVMEICNVCFQALLATHMAFECARGAALVQGPSNFGTGGGGGDGKAKSVMMAKLGSRASVSVSTIGTGADPQTGRPTKDVIATVRWPVRFLFPGMKPLLKMNGLDVLNISVPMAVETPAYG
ncbi:MAG TPA: pilus assembly protein [Elusimicrobiales bacterium]|nr:pilus assembly protein [Elusimicrobiales bacterium]